MIFIEIFDANWWSEHFLYFAGVVGIIIVVLLILIIRRLSLISKEIDKRKRRSTVDLMRETSERNKNPRKRLKF